MSVSEADNLEAFHVLLAARAQVDTPKDDQTAPSMATSKALPDADVDSCHLDCTGRRTLLGLAPEPDEDLLDVTTEQFRAGRSRRFGNSNPEPFEVPFWEGMIRAGITGYQAASRFDGPDEIQNDPVWSAQRFGQSITVLPDGRIVQVGGEHEDHYDPDFCIYNDVFVHHPDGTISIYGYPQTAFPPTDFHTATLIGEFIYLMGSLGYLGTRQYGTTPVYRLHVHSLRIERIATQGTMPGWIYDHTASATSPSGIQITGGKIVTRDGDDGQHNENKQTFILRVDQNFWTTLDTKQ